MSEHTIAAPTSEAMQELGRRVAGMVHGGDVLLLSGPLGAGKTTFAQGFGAGLDITEPIVSPTFTIARELDGHFADGTPSGRLSLCAGAGRHRAFVGRAGIAGIGRRT